MAQQHNRETSTHKGQFNTWYSSRPCNALFRRRFGTVYVVRLSTLVNVTDSLLLSGSEISHNLRSYSPNDVRGRIAEREKQNEDGNEGGHQVDKRETGPRPSASTAMITITRTGTRTGTKTGARQGTRTGTGTGTRT
jgi:hypothetical protein